jgi:hypothetical protein
MGTLFPVMAITGINRLYCGFETQTVAKKSRLIIEKIRIQVESTCQEY